MSQISALNSKIDFWVHTEPLRQLSSRKGLDDGKRNKQPTFKIVVFIFVIFVHFKEISACTIMRIFGKRLMWMRSYAR